MIKKFFYINNFSIFVSWLASHITQLKILNNGYNEKRSEKRLDL